MNTLGFKTHVIIMLVFVAGWAVVYGSLGRITQGDVTHYYYRRVESIFQVMQSFRPQSPTVVFFGPSDVALNVSPTQIKSRLPQVNAYNFGLLMGGPDIMRILAEMLSESLDKKHEKIDLAVLRFMPMMYTKTYRDNVRGSHFPLFTYELPLALLFKLSFREGPQFFARTLYLRLAHDGGGQGSLQTATRRFLGRHTRPEMAGLLDEATDRYVSLWAPSSVAPGEKYWDQSRMGEIDLFAADAMENMVEAHRDALYNVGFLHHRFLFDPLSLKFDETFFYDLDQTIATLNGVAKKIAIFYLPDSLPPKESISIEGRRRLEEKLAELRKDPRVELWDYSSIGITNHDFLDISHLMPEGKAKLNKALAESIGKAL